MNDKLLFEDEFERKMNELPAGNEDASWDKMNLLLEKKDKRRPFAWLVFILCGLLLTILVTTWMLFSDKNKTGKKITRLQNRSADSQPYTQTDKNELGEALSPSHSKDTVLLQDSKSALLSGDSKTLLECKKSKLASTSLLYKTQSYISINNISPAQQKNNQLSNLPSLTKKRNKKIINEKLSVAITPGDISESTNTNKELINDKTFTDTASSIINDTAITAFHQNIHQDSSANHKDIVSKKSVVKSDSNTLTKNKKPAIGKQNRYSIEAGLQFNQSLPFAGQQIISYNYDGNKNFLYDYIPSVYLKLNSRHWFVLTEFSYASPQLIKPFAYALKTSASYSSGTVTTISDHLKKVYYTQLPISFNYNISPHVFAGTGVKFNWFHGAVTSHEVAINDLAADSEKVVTNIIPLKTFTDSFLYKSQASLLFQMGYKIQHWSFSVRYTQGLQSFITYTVPDGSISNKKNTSFQLLIGYSLFNKPLSKGKQ